MWVENTELLFLSNKLINPEIQRELRIPLEFIRFAIVRGKMYKHFANQDVFTLEQSNINKWGNSVVYGAIFLLRDFDFYIRLLDSYHACSLSSLRRNHDYDLHHRVTQRAHGITFDTLDELDRLKYVESSQPLLVQTYVGNPNHPKIRQRIRQNTKASYRIISGIKAEDYKILFKEVGST